MNRVRRLVRRDLGTASRCCAAAVFLALLVGATSAHAQLPTPQADPGDFGLLVPSSGPVRQGENRRALVKTATGEVVALVHVDVGDRRMVIMPSGRLQSVPMSDTKPTQKPFVPLTKKELAQQLKRGPLKDFTARDTGHYLYLYDSSKEFYTATKTILETMYPHVVAYFKRQKFRVAEPPTPLVVIIFHTEQDFQKYHAMPPGVVAYYSAVSNYIVMYEQSKLVELAPDLAAKQSIATIAHEGIHQILHNIGVQKRLSRWPMWISEGLPEYFAPTTVNEGMRWKGVGKPNDLRMYELEQVLKGGETNLAELAEQTVGANQLSSTGYATSWALTHYLARMKSGPFHTYLREVSKLEPFADGDLGAEQSGSAGNRALFAKHFGSDYDKLAKGLMKHLKKQDYADPILNQTHFVMMFATSSQRSAGVTTSPAQIQKWQAANMMSVPPALRSKASFQIRKFKNRGAAEQYANQWLQTN